MGNRNRTDMIDQIDYSMMAFPKEAWKTKKRARQVKRKKHRKSIMHPKGSGYCYLCAALHNDYTYKQTEEHHVVFGSGQRELSEEYGLKVQLCKVHHKYGEEAAHTNREVRELLCRDAQAAFMIEYPNLNWVEIFKKNYL